MTWLREIYQDQSNSLEVLNRKYNVHYWNDWEVEDTGTIGERYGAVVKKHDIINKLLKQLEANPWNRRNIISLWDYQAFEETDGLLPCAFQTMFDVRRVDGEIYLDATLTQRPERAISQADQLLDYKSWSEEDRKMFSQLRMREEQALLAQDYALETARAEGIEQGIEKGLERGKVEGQIFTFLDLVRQHVLTSEFASEQLGMTVAEFEALL